MCCALHGQVKTFFQRRCSRQRSVKKLFYLPVMGTEPRIKGVPRVNYDYGQSTQTKNGLQRTYTDMKDNGQLLFPSGGYRKLKSFQLAQLCFDITVRFVELYIPKNSRTVDQMVQAARSGVQNIAEGSVAAATSKRTELKLTNVARASLEELHLDYEDLSAAA